MNTHCDASSELPHATNPPIIINQFAERNQKPNNPMMVVLFYRVTRSWTGTAYQFKTGTVMRQ
jgi:hypothetical protein